jgi:hypothetical protein
MRKPLYLLILVIGLLLIMKPAHAGTIFKPVFNSGLVGYWSFEEGSGTKVGDFSGQGNTGTWNGAGSHWADGKFGKGGSFNGSGDYVAMGDVLNFGTGDFTITAWIKHVQSETFPYWEGIVDKCWNTNWSFYGTREGYSSIPCIGFAIAGNYSTERSGATPVTDGKWHHVVVVADRDNVATFYVDGKVDGDTFNISGSSSVNLSSGSGYTVRLGMQDCNNMYWNGSIDEVRVYNRDLSASEVSRLYTSGATKFGINRLGPVADDLPSNAAIGLVRQNCAGYSNCSTSLSAWQTYMLTGGGIDWTGCTVGDLTCANVNKVAVAKIDGPWTSEDSTAVTLTGWTTDADNYIKIYTTAAARHNGKWDDDTKYRLIITGAHGIYINEGNVRIDGLQVSVTPSSYYDGIVFQSTGTSNNDFRVSNNIIKAINSAADWPAGIELWDSGSGTFRAWNNIIYDFNYGTVNFGIVMADNAGGYTGYVYNNTIHNCIKGLARDAGTFIAINNIVKGSGDTNAYVGTFSGSDYNATDGVDTTGQGAHSRTSQTFKFVDETNDDFHLAPADTGARDYGVSNPGSGLFSTDIDRQNRGAPWDIGADEALFTKVNSSQNNQITNGLVGLWSFNGPDIDGNEAIDRSGNGNNGTITGAVPTRGKVGQALDFNGSSNYVSVTDNSSFNFNSGFTVSAWIYPHSWGVVGDDYIHNIFTDEDTGVCCSTFVFRTGSQGLEALKQRVGLTNGSADRESSSNLTLNTWQHIVATHDGTNVRFYINGILDRTQAGWALVNIAEDWRIGVTVNNTRHWDGTIDELRVYNRALTDQEILRLYNLGR